MANEAFARVKIDQLLKDTDGALTDGRSVRFAYSLDDGGKADYALFDRQGHELAVLEDKSTNVNLSAGEAQGRATPISSACPSSFSRTARKCGSATRPRAPIFAASKQCPARTISRAGRRRARLAPILSASLLKRLFVVDRNTVAVQTEDAFAEHLPHLPRYRVQRVAEQAQRLEATDRALDPAASKVEAMAAALSAEIFDGTPTTGEKHG